MMVFFEPSPLATGVIFIGVLFTAIRDKRLSRKGLGRLLLHPVLAFLCVYVVFAVFFAFDLVEALRSVLKEQASFVLETHRGYWPWVGGNTKEFLYAAGTPIMVIFVYWVARIVWQWGTSRKGVMHWSMDTVFVLSLLVVFGAVVFLGVNRGETSRLWIYLAVLFTIPASLLIARSPRSPLLFFSVASALVIQSIVALQRVGFVVP